MKKLFFFLSLICLCVSCSIAEENYSVENNAEETVTLNFNPYIIETITRGAISEVTGIKRLDIFVIEGTNVTEIHQVNTEEGFGSASITLNKIKTYTLIALAHKADAAVTYSNGLISYPENKVKDTFYYKNTFTPSTTTELSCEMHRIVGQFSLETTDVVPEGVVNFRLTVYDSHNKWNTSNDAAANTTNQIANFANFSKKNDGTVAFSTNILSTSEGTNFTIKAEGLNSDNEVIQEMTFTNVPIRNGYKTIYRGAFFNVSLALGFTGLADWQSLNTTEF